MGGKNKPDNSAVVQQQQQQAAEEAAKEKARQDRLKTGLASIKDAFEGSPTMASKAFDWNTFKPRTNEAERQYEAVGGTSTQSGQQLYNADLPAGYTIRKVAGSPLTGTGASTSAAAASSPSRFAPTTGQNDNVVYNSPFKTLVDGKWVSPNVSTTTGIKTGNTNTTMAGYDANAPGGSSYGGGAGADAWEIVGPDGKVHKQGEAFDIMSPDGGHTGGFDDAFYNKYKQSVLDYYMPQVQDQYTKAKQQAIYGLGRSGNLRSSAANDLTADLAKQNTINEAGVRNQADSAAGDLRNQVSTERQKATSQLYATEDPEVSSNQALAAVRDISLKQPDLSPLSAIFDVASIGGAGLYKGYQGQQNLNAFNGALAKSKDRYINN